MKVITSEHGCREGRGSRQEGRREGGQGGGQAGREGEEAVKVAVNIDPEDFDKAAAYCASWYSSGVWERMQPAEKEYYRGKLIQILRLCGILDG